MQRWGWPILLALAAGPAWGQSKADIMAAVGGQLTAYVGCLERHTHDIAQSSVPQGSLLTLAKGDAIISKAFASCQNERRVLITHLEMPPLNASADDAALATQQLDDRLRPEMHQSILDALYGSP